MPVFFHEAINNVFQRSDSSLSYGSFCFISRWKNFNFVLSTIFLKICRQTMFLDQPILFLGCCFFLAFFLEAATASVEYFDFIEWTRTKQKNTSTQINKYFTPFLNSNNMYINAKSSHQISFFRCRQIFNRHVKTYTDRVQHVYPKSEYTLPEILFDKLDWFGIS